MKLAVKIYLFSSVLRLFLIFVSSFVTLIGLDSDAIGFFEKVQFFNWSKFDLFSTDSNIFVIWNYFIMSIIGFSITVGQMFCFLAWSISFLFFYKSVLLFQVKRRVVFGVLMVYCFFPSSVLYSIGFLRESYELMFCNMGFYFFLKLEKRFSLAYWLFSFISFILAALLHINFFVYVILVVCWPTLGFLRKIENIWIRFFLFFLVIYSVNYLFSTELVLDLLNTHALGAEVSSDSRANYFNFSEPRSILLGFLKFLYEPIFRGGLIYQDWVVVIENIVRLFILFTCMIKLKISFFFNTIFIFFLLGTFAWSLFTYNWGTGIRHHMPQLGMLLVLLIFAHNQTNTTDNG